MGHIVAFKDRPQMIQYFMRELGASCSNGANYCNRYQDSTVTYIPGPSAGTPPKYEHMPSSYALVGSYEDFAETWREVVTRAYIRSGDTTYIRQARLVYNFNIAPLALNHDIGRRRKVMNSIINGSWK
jgi:hypothetical protein